MSVFQPFCFFSCKRHENKSINHMNILSLCQQWRKQRQHINSDPWAPLRVTYKHIHTHPHIMEIWKVTSYTYSTLQLHCAISWGWLMEGGQMSWCTIRRFMESQRNSNTPSSRLRGSLWTTPCLLSVAFPGLSMWAIMSFFLHLFPSHSKTIENESSISYRAICPGNKP